MREIKFRAKTVLDGEWIYGSLIYHMPMKSDYKRCYIVPVSDNKIDAYEKSVFESTIGQYTGLKDKNGVEIYEGDIIAGKYPPLNGRNPYVAFQDGKFASIIDGDIFWDLYRLIFEDGFYVIGNIHDNPELLEGK